MFLKNTAWLRSPCNSQHLGRCLPAASCFPENKLSGSWVGSLGASPTPPISVAKSRGVHTCSRRPSPRLLSLRTTFFCFLLSESLETPKFPPLFKNLYSCRPGTRLLRPVPHRSPVPTFARSPWPPRPRLRTRPLAVLPPGPAASWLCSFRTGIQQRRDRSNGGWHLLGAYSLPGPPGTTCINSTLDNSINYSCYWALFKDGENETQRS